MKTEPCGDAGLHGSHWWTDITGPTQRWCPGVHVNGCALHFECRNLALDGGR